MVRKRQNQKLSLMQQAINATANEYFENTSLNGFGLLYYLRRRKYQRLFWFIFIALGIGCATYVVLYSLYGSLGDPTITSPHTPYALIWDLPFPAVAICSVNKLSRSAVLQYAEQQSNNGQAVSDWVKRLGMLTALFDGSAVNVTAAIQAEHDMELEFPVASLLDILTPSCDDLLLECEWAGQQQNCLTIFTPLATSIGQCCAFNYRPERELRAAGISSNQGLTLRLNATVRDYFSAAHKSNSSGAGVIGGFTLQIFDPHNFPDIDIGYLQQFIVVAGERVQVQLFISTQLADADAHAVGKLRRRCYFADEDPSGDENEDVYSHANCLLRCKVATIIEQCGCVPYYATANATVHQCSLMHIHCMRQHRVEWHKRVTSTQSHLAWCTHCMPMCSYQRYLYRKQRLWQPPKQSTSEDIIVQLYFPTLDAINTYRKDVIYTWYQVLSNIGGVLGICMGCSFISGFEIIYFLGYRLSAQYNKLKTEN